VQFEAGNGNNASDNCGLDWSTFKYLRESVSAETCPQTLVRWYEIYDMCGNRRESFESIIINDETRPYALGDKQPKDLFAVCEVPKPYSNRKDFDDNSGVNIIENCNFYTVTHLGDSITDSSGCPLIIIRKYRVADFCNNYRDFKQKITVNDTIPPTIICPPSLAFDARLDELKTLSGLAYSDTEMQIANAGFAAAGINVKDNCIVDRVTYKDTTTGFCPVVITRTFTVYDACDNTNFCTQEIKLLQLAKPVFDTFGPYCLNSTPDVLPTLSKNGIKGTWKPATIDTKTIATQTYTFTPDADQCADPIDVLIEITNEIKPIFMDLGPFCVNSIAPELPTESDNKITGKWEPGKIKTDSVGYFDYTFTPDPNQCAIPVVIQIEITDEIKPVFAALGPFCLGSVAPPLPLMSDNKITGSWSPSKIATNVLDTFEYTFTPDPGQCAGTFVMEIIITDDIVPVFANLGPFCLNTVAPPLPLDSDNGITGKWNPAKVETGKVGPAKYQFIPDPGQCSKPIIIEIIITDEIIPEFAAFGPYCLNSIADDLPLISKNGVLGKWTPAKILTNKVGTAKYTFTPAPMQCANPITIEIKVFDLITPTFDKLTPQCPNTGAPELPTVSKNGITGTWNPAFVDTKKQGIFSFTFTPDSGQCAIPVKLSIDISDKIPPDAVCQNITVYLDADGRATITTAQIDNGSSDNCELDTLFLSRYDFDCADIGKNPVRLTAVDYVGLTDYCDAIVTVLDTVSPVVVCKEPFEIQLDANAQYTLTVFEVLESAKDNCSDIDTMYVYPHELDCDHIGLTTLTLWVIDVHGNKSYCESQVFIYGNRAPTVVDDSTTTKENIPVVIDVISNDYDEKTSIDISSLRISIKPKHGRVSIDPKNGDLTYTPDLNFSGLDVFQYSICDDGIPCEPECGNAFVFVRVDPVNDKPIARDDYYNAGCYSISGNILDNDWDDDGTENLNVSTIPLYPPNHGEVTIDPDGMIYYYPNDGFIGIDSFAYVICDNGIPSMCDTATVYIEVDCSMENPDPIECELFIPEGFSPNEDGIHDFFRIMCIEHYPDAKLMIFNRNGNLLWEKEHYGNYDYWGDQYNAWWWGTTVLSKFDIGKQMINGEPKVKFGNYVYVLLLGNGEEKNGTVMVAY
jgi:gliding motility-associated-like protein